MNNKYLAYAAITIITVISITATIYIYWQSTQLTKTPTPEVYNSNLLTGEISIEGERDLIANQPTTLPIYFTTQEDIATIVVMMEYDETVLEISDQISNESDLFDTVTASIDNISTQPTARKITITANNTTTGVNTNGTQALLGNLRAIPKLPQGETQTSTTITILYSDTIDGSSMIPLTSQENMLAQPTNPTYSISTNDSTNNTTLSIEEKELILNQQDTLDITLQTQQTITKAEIILEYDPTYLEISSQYTEGTQFDELLLFENDQTTGQLLITVQDDQGVDGSQGSITIVSLKVTPLEPTTSTRVAFDFELESQTDSNVVNITNEDILTNVKNATLTILEGETNLQCYQKCTTSTDCPGDSKCTLTNGDKICINLDCTNQSICSCPESEYQSSSNDLDSPTPTPKATITPTPIVEDLPKAGSAHITYGILALGISALLLGLITKKGKPLEK